MRTVSIGAQGFEDIRIHNDFYVDKTDFIREWWESRVQVTLITRPRRFGKTLNMDMLNCFFSRSYAGRGDLFKGLKIWEDERYREMQGTWPVIYLSFADVKEDTFQQARISILMTIQRLFRIYKDVWENDSPEEKEKQTFLNLETNAGDAAASRSLQLLSDYLYSRYGKKVLIFLDEYDTPLQEAYVNGYWREMAAFIRGLFNATFKTNKSLERAVLTGITRVSKESIFSDFNNAAVAGMTVSLYETAFGFTEDEVFEALKEYGLYDQRKKVKEWYDGFTFGTRRDIYNPWSITNYLKWGKLGAYWANSSSNRLVSDLIRRGDPAVKMDMENLLQGETIRARINEEIVYADLEGNPVAIWSLLFASGYLCYVSVEESDDLLNDVPIFTLRLTNGEVRRMFGGMIRRWFGAAGSSNDGFISAMIRGDEEAMNSYMNDIASDTFSSFDTGEKPSKNAPERFYHGFVLGLLVHENADYTVRSNRESGQGRYDVCMFPKKKGLPGIIMEFKVRNRKAGEKTLQAAAENALKQIRDKNYAADLKAAGAEQIHAYGFAFAGKKLLIRKDNAKNGSM